MPNKGSAGYRKRLERRRRRNERRKQTRYAEEIPPETMKAMYEYSRVLTRYAVLESGVVYC